MLQILGYIDNWYDDFYVKKTIPHVFHYFINNQINEPSDVINTKIICDFIESMSSEPVHMLGRMLGHMRATVALNIMLAYAETVLHKLYDANVCNQSAVSVFYDNGSTKRVQFKTRLEFIYDENEITTNFIRKLITPLNVKDVIDDIAWIAYCENSKVRLFVSDKYKNVVYNKQVETPEDYYRMLVEIKFKYGKKFQSCFLSHYKPKLEW